MMNDATITHDPRTMPTGLTREGRLVNIETQRQRRQALATVRETVAKVRNGLMNAEDAIELIGRTVEPIA
jgi:hypothetical protein